MSDVKFHVMRRMMIKSRWKLGQYKSMYKYNNSSLSLHRFHAKYDFAQSFSVFYFFLALSNEDGRHVLKRFVLILKSEILK